MLKAYDRIEWDFLDAALVRFGFVTCWIGWVMEFVRIVSFVMLFNGKPLVMFSPNRGFRQGDPISLYHFILCDGNFSHLLRRAEKREI